MDLVKIPVVWLLLLVPAAGLRAAEVNAPLPLEQAERLAVEYDAELEAVRAEAEALAERSVVAGSLPDPKFKFGLMNFPTDTFRRDQEPMTQVQVGVQQMFPGGDTLSLRSRQFTSRSEEKRAMVRNRLRQVQKQARRQWLELFYWLRAERIIEKNLSLFRNLVSVTQSQYAAGRQQQQDVIRADLELGLLEDRLTEIGEKQAVARAGLARLIGASHARRPLSDNLPDFPVPETYTRLVERIDDHPRLHSANAQVNTSRVSIELARQSYKPDWMLELNYGFRDGTGVDGSDRPDFLSAMVMVDMPLFTANRQDRKVAASRLQHNASLKSREDLRRQLLSELEADYAKWQRLQERVDLYETRLVPQARENAKSALLAYQSRRGEFTALMRARITALDTQLKLMRLRVDSAKTLASIRYLVGDAQ